MRQSSTGRRVTLLATMTTSLALAASPVLAQAQTNNKPAPSSTKDPNRIICQRIEETGSRVASKRVCMTAQQWEEQRRSDREYVEDAQQRSIEPTSG